MDRQAAALLAAGGDDAPPSLVALCLARLARGAPQRVLLCLLRRLPEELVLSLLAQMVASRTVTDDRLAAFFTIARRVLSLSGCCAIRNSVLRQIPFRCPELRCLDLSNCAQVTNSVVRAVLQGCSSLQTLRLDGCRHITDAAFQPDHSPFYPLRACTSLQVVSFARCSQLTKSLVVFLIKACRSLTDINFSRCKRINDDAIHLLVHSATSLERLNLSFVDSISDAAFTTEPSDQRNGFLAMGRALRHLDLTQSSVSDVTLVALAQHCRRLESIKLGSCSNITDAGVEALVRSCVNLRELDLTNCAGLTDRGARAIGDFGLRLERLDLSWCLSLTDKAAVDLARGCERLLELRLVWCTQLTDATVDAFAAAIAHRRSEDASSEHKASTRRVRLCVAGCKGVTPARADAARAQGLDVELAA